MNVNNFPLQKLIFVYNADSGVRNLILDSAHKIFSPSTYACNLCDITYGVFTENSIWKNFRKETDFEMEFLHKDEFIKTYSSELNHKFTFPIVLIEEEKELEIFVETEELNKVKNANELINMIKALSL